MDLIAMAAFAAVQVSDACGTASPEAVMAKGQTRTADGDGVEAANASTLTSIARSLAYLALKADSKISGADILTKVKFLEEQLGLGRADAASVLGSSPDSIRVLMYLARKKTGKGGRRGGPRK
jgi:hypothetical protein